MHSFWKEQEQGIWVGDSGQPGNNVALVTGVHGDEPTSHLLADHLLKHPPMVEQGSVTLITASPLARERKEHYIDTNLNRCFLQEPSESVVGYEAERAELIKPFLLAADAMLDTHDTSSPCKEFFICERNSLEVALRIGRSSAGPGMTISYGFSAMEPGGTDDFMFQQGKVGICHETGDMFRPEVNLPRALEVATRFLIVQGLVEGEVDLPDVDPMLVEVYRKIVTAKDFTWIEKFSNFQLLSKGQIIAQNGGELIVANEGDVMLFPAVSNRVGDEACELARRVDS